MERGNLALELKRCLWQAGDVFLYRYHLLMGQIAPMNHIWQVKELAGQRNRGPSVTCPIHSYR